MQTKLHVQLLEHTPDPERLIAIAAKLCYAGCDINELAEKQTPEAVNKFLDTLVNIGHESPMEHVSFTFAVEGVSRALTHQLVRHRIASYSQVSQRYVKLNQFNYIIPPVIENNETAKDIYIKKMEDDQRVYDELVDILCDEYAQQYIDSTQYGKNNLQPTSIKPYEVLKIIASGNEVESKKVKSVVRSIEKKSIEDARYVFPNACETKIIVTMNFRTLINFIQHRACQRAQWEIRELAIEMIRLLKPVLPKLSLLLAPKCCTSKCPEGNLSCMKMTEQKEFFKNL